LNTTLYNTCTLVSLPFCPMYHPRGKSVGSFLEQWLWIKPNITGAMKQVTRSWQINSQLTIHKLGCFFCNVLMFTLTLVLVTHLWINLLGCVPPDKWMDKGDVIWSCLLTTKKKKQVTWFNLNTVTEYSGFCIKNLIFWLEFWSIYFKNMIEYLKE